ncbi:MAG: hypothetical protein QOI35_1515 [Cryptosporangiaceae bacterium]|nr:hypothetical protein [Cryptosporangiaceae bacterium]
MSPAPGRTLAGADTELARLTAACEAIAANLVEFDADPAKASLDAGPLTGRTQAAWAEATAAAAQLWSGYSTLRELTGRATDLRAGRHLDAAAFAELVLGPSVTLSVTAIPVAERTLLGPGQTTVRCTPAELLASMEAAYTVARSPVARAGAVWSRLIPASAAAAAALADARRQVTEAGAGAATLAAAEQALRAFTGTLESDPLGCREADLAAAEALAARAAAEATSAARLLGSLRDRLAAAHGLAARITEARVTAGPAESAARAAFGTAEDGDGDPSLAADLTGLDALAAAGQWPLLGSRLAAWTATATRRLCALEDAQARNAAAVAERAELRGRLGAYRAKASRLGGAERPDLTDLADAAKSLLYTAPCDLAAARTAVERYQTAVASLTATTTDRGQR